MAALKLTVVSRLVVVGGQRRLGHADRLGPGARRLPRQARRRRAHRPAIRAAHDRRRTHRCSRSTAPTARSASTWPTRVRGVVVALLFVTLPFVVRTVQPVLIELDQSRWRRPPPRSAPAGSRRSGGSCCPNLLPAILSGTALAFARAISEFGSTVLISGNLPFKTQVVVGAHLRADRERQHDRVAAAVSTVLLVSRSSCCSRSTCCSAGRRVVAERDPGQDALAARSSLRFVAICLRRHHAAAPGRADRSGARSSTASAR